MSRTTAYRHSTTTLFAALDVANGTVLTRCRAAAQVNGGFLTHCDTSTRPGSPAKLDLHLIVDNYATHSIPRCGLGWRAIRTSICITRRP